MQSAAQDHAEVLTGIVGQAFSPAKKIQTPLKIRIFVRMPSPQTVFISGATGYMGRELIPPLLARGHAVRGLVRRGSEKKLPPGCSAATGDALDAPSFAEQVRPAETFVHLVGVPKPAP